MSEHAVSQGQSPVIAARPSEGVIAAGQTARRTVSADSFRKLTAFLKKETFTVEPESIPEPVIVAPEPTAVAPVSVAKPITVEPVIEFVPASILVEPVFVSVVKPITVEPVIEFVPEPEIFAVTPQPTPPVPIMEIVPAPEPLPEPLPEPEPAPAPARVAAKAPSSILRQRPRDAFALSPSALDKQKPIVAAPAPTQTPQQEQETAELARSLLDMMASGASSGQPQERALAADTLLRMLPRLPTKSMIMLAERLCMMETPPHLLVAKLICDPRIEVAGPLLEECMHITDEDLTLVINEGLPAKRRMMARRRRISRAITSQLVHTGDPSVLLTLVRNVSAEIPHESFIELVHLAASQQEILTPLCTRPDLPVPFAFELFWLAPAQLRRYLLSRFLTDSETLTKILKIALETNGDDATKAEFPDPDRIKDALQMFADGKADEAAAALAACAQIDAATAARILNDKQGEPLAALFKAVGVPRLVVSEILDAVMRSSSGILDPTRDPEELQSLFDSLSFNKARILLTYWDWATLQTGPYAALN